ncbi:MAG: methionine adenosyltransferase [Chloroflexota bacterium]|nr:methionine adenosyltransferase [Chloroflexota bacterium]
MDSEMRRNIVVSESESRSVEDLPVEIVERKGIGHPDSLCDGIAERISVEYSRWCKEKVGHILHHNFDKVQLVAGEVDVHFGGGQMIRPIRIQIAGRATPSYRDKKVPLEYLATEAARSYLGETMRHLDPVKHVAIECYAGRGASELVDVVHQVTANDTSFGVSHWPRSTMERLVYETANFINFNLIDQFPIGEDVKVMGYRMDEEIALTVSLPFLAFEISNARAYGEAKEAARQAIQKFSRSLAPHPITVFVNTADELEGCYYLTLTGTSAENGDDGAVGRGNRVDGLIAPFRSNSFEAACGKNPISHVGKIYNVLALLTAQKLVRNVDEVAEATVYILSQIGKPLDQPLVANARIRPVDKLSSELKADVAECVDDMLAQVDEVGARILRREIPLF